MFYISLENQIHLLIVLIFSAYIYLSSLTIKLDSFLKNIGVSFFTPLVLGIMSFLTLNSALSESYIFFSEFILLTAILVIIAFKKIKELNSIVFILLYAFPLGTILLNLNFGFIHKHVIFNICLFAYLGIIFLVILICIIRKRHSMMVLYTGIISLSASLVIPRINTIDIAIVASLLFKASGYIFIAYFFYRSSFHKLESDYTKVSGELSRINDNIEREINIRVAQLERLNVRKPELAKTDNLSGTYTNKAILNFTEVLIEQNPGREFSILLVDIDNYREISNKIGYNAGNKCIKDLAEIIRNIVPADYKIGRFDDAGYMVVMPGANAEDACRIAEQLKNRVGATNDPHFRISAGVVTYPQDAGNLKDIIIAAKKALRASKNS